MLAGTVRSLINRGDRVACIARSRSSLDALAATIPKADLDRLSTHPCDYHSSPRFARALDALPFEPSSAICWLHAPAEPVLDLIRSRFPEIDLLQVVGSSAKILQDERYAPDRIVRLGFVIEAGCSRWLRDEEISIGVYEAFTSDLRNSIVGVIEPWNMRP